MDFYSSPELGRAKVSWGPARIRCIFYTKVASSDIVSVAAAGRNRVRPSMTSADDDDGDVIVIHRGASDGFGCGSEVIRWRRTARG